MAMEAMELRVLVRKEFLGSTLHKERNQARKINQVNIKWLEVAGLGDCTCGRIEAVTDLVE